MSIQPTPDWRDLIGSLRARDAQLFAAYELRGSTPQELAAMAEIAAAEYRFQNDCDAMFSSSGAEVPDCAEVGEWWGPGEGHAVTYRYLTVTSVQISPQFHVEIATEVELTGSVEPLRIEIDIDGSKAVVDPQQARAAAAALTAASNLVERAA